jgi:hypothetical protein
MLASSSFLERYLSLDSPCLPVLSTTYAFLPPFPPPLFPLFIYLPFVPSLLLSICHSFLPSPFPLLPFPRSFPPYLSVIRSFLRPSSRYLPRFFPPLLYPPFVPSLLPAVPPFLPSCPFSSSFLLVVERNFINS